MVLSKFLKLPSFLCHFTTYNISWVAAKRKTYGQIDVTDFENNVLSWCTVCQGYLQIENKIWCGFASILFTQNPPQIHIEIIVGSNDFKR